MNLKQYILKEDPEILSYIVEMPADSIILEDYFYSTGSNIFSSNSIYSEKQIANILNLTDREYVDLVEKYVKNSPTQSLPNNSLETENTQKQIDELESKVAKSKDYEESLKKIAILEKELETTEKDLSAVLDIENKYKEAYEEYSRLSYLTKFNLPKIHDDLVDIMNKLREIEDKILNFKGEQIKNSYKRTEIDKGKVVLSIGWLLAVALIIALLVFLSVPEVFIWIGSGAGLVIFAILIFTAKIEAEYFDPEDPHYIDIDEIKREAEHLKARRNAILKIVNARNSDDFFHMKARLGSAAKTLRYLKEQKSLLFEQSDFTKLLNRKSEIENELAVLKEKTKDDSVLIKPDDYLKLYREIDSLKLKLNQLKQNLNLTKPDIVEKLKNIRKELTDKLPGYRDLLVNTFKASFERINEYITESYMKLSTSPAHIDPEGKNFDNLSLLQKTLVEYFLAKSIYQRNFAFIVEYLSRWQPEEREMFRNFIETSNPEETKFYVVDEKLNF